jgi:4'-phosphopantetheinyl transferase
MMLFGVCQSDSLSDDEFSVLFSMASAQRKDTAGRFFRREDACRSIVAEALIRYVVKTAAGLRTNNICFVNNEYGKPMISGLGLHFNSAHSGEWVICGIDKHEIGVDIETHRPIDPGIANRFFSKTEIDLLNAPMADESRFKMFFDIWSLKESYIKAIGKGLSCPLDNFACLPSMKNEQVEFQRYREELPVRSFHLIEIDPTYSCAICCTHKETMVDTFMLTPEQLIGELFGTI